MEKSLLKVEVSLRLGFVVCQVKTNSLKFFVADAPLILLLLQNLGC